MTPVVKICGLRRLADAELSMDLGARYLGCVLAADSPRCAEVAEVKSIAAAAAARAEVVLVFRKTSQEQILRRCEETGVRRVQIHGTSPGACRMLAFYGIEVHPVFRVAADATRLPELDPLPTPGRPAVLDGGAGGAGLRFAWDLLGAAAPDAVLIAGGTHAGNVAELLRHRPYGIDVSSGVEVSPGVKDAAELRKLLGQIEAAAHNGTEVRP